MGCMYSCLITERLTNQNHTVWWNKRLIYFSRVSFAPKKDDDFTRGKPTLDYAELLNTCMAACFDFKRCIFLFIRAVANDKQHLMIKVCELTMLYYSLQDVWAYRLLSCICSSLLAWQELTAHTPYLIAAVMKFEVLGSDGPFCKFLYNSVKRITSKAAKSISTEPAAKLSISSPRKSYKRVKYATDIDYFDADTRTVYELNDNGQYPTSQKF